MVFGRNLTYYETEETIERKTAEAEQRFSWIPPGIFEVR